MLKGFFIYYILSILTGNPLVAILLLLFLYVIFDRAYFRLLPDMLAPLKRQARVKSLQAQLNVNPADATAAQDLGILYFEKKNYVRALEYLERASTKVKNSARLYLYMGMSYMKLGQSGQGYQALLKALEIEPKVGRGLPYIYLLQHEINQPQLDNDRVKSLEETFEGFANTENFFRMGLVYKNQGNKEKANQMFEKALADYAYVPKALRKIHRRWALLARLHKLLTV